MSVPGYFVSDDKAKLDLDVIHGFLEQSYWSPGIPRETVERAIKNSICFGVFEEKSGKQVGFARVVTDQATFAYVADVFVLEAHQGKGLAQLLLKTALAYPNLQGLRRWALATRDAHSLYARLGFTPLSKPERFMELHHPDVYRATRQK